MHFVVRCHHDETRAYAAGVPMRDQDLWDQHAAFMDQLTDDGFVLLGGLVGDGDRALLLVEAPDARAVAARLSPDPWLLSGHLTIDGIEPWDILLGSPDRLRSC